MQFFDLFKNSTNQWLDPFCGHTIAVKREDRIHPLVSGNKFRKLKYVLTDYRKDSKFAVLTFGGAFSNHLAATAAAGKQIGFKTIGIVRGEEWQSKIAESATLHFCQTQGMRLICVSREEYKDKDQTQRIQSLLINNIKIKVIPEGGTSELAIKGCEEILTTKDQQFDVICSSVGTGGTLSGLINSAAPDHKIIGFNALKNPAIESTIGKYTDSSQWWVESRYTFGGYAKINEDLIKFMNHFYQQYKIPLDPIYTGKMVFGIFDLIEKNKWNWGKKILIIHTGGLQGVIGMNHQLQKKGKPLLKYAPHLL